MEFDVRDNGDGTYHVTGRMYEDSGECGVFFLICGGIAYLLTIIGLIVGTISVANAAPSFVWLMVVLDLLVLSPIVVLPAVAVSRAKRSKDDNYTSYDDSYGASVAKAYGAAFKFLLRNAYMAFAVAIAAYWVLFCFNIGGYFANGLMFFCMYGMYYFPYLMLSSARKYGFKALSVTAIVSVFVAIAACCLCAAYFGRLDDRYAFMYPVVLPTVLGLFSLVSLPIARRCFMKNGFGKGALSIKWFFIILGGALVLVAAILSML